MKNLLCSILITLFTVSTIWAQFPGVATGTSTRTKGIGKITGTVLEEKEGAVVEFSTISLYREEKLIDGTLADSKGDFVLNELIDGNYRLEISFIGFEKKVVEDILVEKERNVNLGEIYLVEDINVLKEVEVTGQRSLIEERVDRLIFNAEQDKTTRGGDAADVLRRVPMLSVDLEGNVSLRGSSNITVLIDNKPSTIVATNVSDALKMLPADLIKSVEVITSPSAKYDAEGSGGIINIITKKNNLEGYYLNLDTGFGIRGSNLGLNGSLRKGKFGMTLGGFGRAFYNESERSMTQLTKSNNTLTEQSSDSDDLGVFGRYNLGLDYDIDKTQFISGGVRYGIRRFSIEELQTTDLFSDSQLLRSNLRDIDSRRFSGTVDLNVDYLKRFSPGHEFSISTLYSYTDENSDFTSNNLTAEEQAFINGIKNDNNNLNREITFQTDYIRPIGDNQIFEIGGKGIMRQVNSEFSYLFANSEDDFFPDFTRPAGSLDYNQDVAAAYSSYTLALPSKYTFKAGVRYERTFINAIQDGENIDIPDYDNLVPSVNISKTFENFTTIKLGYNRRIQRPWLRQLNPNVNLQNSQNIEVGNPDLRPELANNLELGFSKLIKSTYLNISVFGRNTNNAINRVRYPIDSLEGAILTTYDNIGKERSLGMNVFANVNLSKKWTINGGFNLRYADLEGQVTGIDGTTVSATNTGWNYGGRLMSQYKFNDGWTAQAFTFLRGRRVELQGNRGGFGIYAIGLNKDFNDNKGSIGFGFENFLQRGWNVRSELNSALFTQESNVLRVNRNVKINFSYRFGKMDIRKSRKKTRSVRNDDLMGDSDGGMQGGGDIQQGGGSTPNRSRGARPSSKSDKQKKNATVDAAKALDIDFTGQWKGITQSPRGELALTFDFKVMGSTLTGSFTTPRGSKEISNGKVEEGKFTFEMSFGPMTMVQNGIVVEENKIILSNDRGEMELIRVQ
ncbi:MAG: outer membrane beta-barrel family protein [Bacteroidota bacterium]